MPVQQHGGEVFSTEIIEPNHPIMKGYEGFQSWDETYIHTKHNERNRIVLEVRKQGGQAEGVSAEPWTWVRTQGKGVACSIQLGGTMNALGPTPLSKPGRAWHSLGLQSRCLGRQTFPQSQRLHRTSHDRAADRRQAFRIRRRRT